MELIVSECNKTKDFVIRTELHRYKTEEEKENFAQIWIKAGFTNIYEFIDERDNTIIVMYQRTLSRRF